MRNGKRKIENADLSDALVEAIKRLGVREVASRLELEGETVMRIAIEGKARRSSLTVARVNLPRLVKGV
jgi:hypothetical protein